MEEQRQKSWFARNWGWVLGGGCLTMIIIVVFVIGGAIFKVADVIKESETYTYAYDRTINNERVIELLGEPIDTDGIGNTSYNYVNGKTSVVLSIPIKGPKGNAEIFVNADEIDDEWVYNSLYVQIKDTKENIDLLEEGLDDE